MAKPSEKRYHCGYAQCDREATIRVLSDPDGGYFGHVCAYHANYLNRDMEHRMQDNLERYPEFHERRVAQT